MPHQCVKCGQFYPDKSQEIISGCTGCGGKLFFYVKRGKAELLAAQRQRRLDSDDKKEIETDVSHLIGSEIARNAPVVLDGEAVRIEKPGTYELDLVTLFNEGNPVIYKLGEGKYVVDLPETFRKAGKR